MSRISFFVLSGILLLAVAGKVEAEGETIQPESPVIEPQPEESAGEDTPPSTDEGMETTDDLEEEASRPGGSERVTEALAQQFSVETEQINSLRDQGLGYGEISHALQLAETMPGGITDENISQIMAMRKEEGMGWGRIAQELDFKLGQKTGKGHASPIVADPGTMEPGNEVPESPLMSHPSASAGSSVIETKGGARALNPHGGGHGPAGAHGPGFSAGHGAGGAGGLPGGRGGGGSSVAHGKSGAAPGHNR